MDVAAIIGLIENSLTATSLLLLVVGGARGWYLWGSSHRETIAAYQAQIEQLQIERDRWINAAERGTEIAAGLTRIVTENIEPPTRRRRPPPDRRDPE